MIFSIFQVSRDRVKWLTQWFSNFFSHSSLTNPDTVNSSPAKIINDNCKNFTIPTLRKQ